MRTLRICITDEPAYDERITAMREEVAQHGKFFEVCHMFFFEREGKRYLELAFETLSEVPTCPRQPEEQKPPEANKDEFLWKYDGSTTGNPKMTFDRRHS